MWHPYRTALWRKSSSRPPCRPRACATLQLPLPSPSATVQPGSGSTRIHRGRSKVAVRSRGHAGGAAGAGAHHCSLSGLLWHTFLIATPPHPLPGPGPFTTQEMAEWFQAGYFSMALLVKRGCDEGFQPLGEVIKMWGRVPFAPGPSPPPLLVSIPTFARSREGRWELDGGQRGVWSTRSKLWECFCPHSGQHGPGAAEEATGAGSSGLVPAAAAPAISSTGQQVPGPRRASK